MKGKLLTNGNYTDAGLERAIGKTFDVYRVTDTIVCIMGKDLSEAGGKFFIGDVPYNFYIGTDVEILKDSETETTSDPVNHPSHYTQGKYEVIEVIEDATKNLTGIKAVCLANVLKYVLRFQYKNGLQDLKKANWYLNRLIKEVEKDDTSV